MRYTKDNINGLIINSSTIKGNRDINLAWGGSTFQIKVDGNKIIYVYSKLEKDENCDVDTALKCLNKGNNGVYWTVMSNCPYDWYNKLKFAFL